MALRTILPEMGMPSVPSVLSIPGIGTALNDDGTTNEAWIDKAAGRFLEEFEWYAKALKAQRQAEGTPY